MNITESEITEFLKKYEIVTNTHNFSNVSELIHTDALYRFTDGDFAGIDAIRKAFEETWENIKDEVYSVSNLKIISADQNSASITYSFSWLGIVDGKLEKGIGRGTNVIVREGDKLQFIHEHLSK